ncbi:MAG: glycosyl hydrolase [Candidatus Saccharibacteria bacterium]|nr:glycosyl hydrolase [Candidatus Saccharibacteria bacterium]
MLLLRATTESLQLTSSTVGGLTTYQFPSDNNHSPGSAFNDATDLVIGVLVAVTQSSISTGTRFYSPSPGVTVTPLLFDDATNNMLASGPSVVTSGTGWVFLPFSLPYTLSPGVSYVAAALTLGGQYYAATGTSFPYTDGPVYNTAPDAGRWLYSSFPKNPTNTVTTRYGIDIVVQSGAFAPVPILIGRAYQNPGQSNTLTVTPDSTLSVGNWMILVLSTISGTTVTNPSGWTVLQSYTVAGTLGVAIYAKVRAAGESTYSVTLNANGVVSTLTLFWGNGADAISNWIIGTNMLRGSITPTTTTNTVAPSITTTASNTLALVITTERTIADESGIISMAGATPWFYGKQSGSAQLETTTIGIIAQTAPGATGDVTTVYPNTQAVNAMAIQIGIPPGNGTLQFSASFSDTLSGDVTNSSNEGVITTATSTAVIPAPASSVFRLAKLITVVNTDLYVTNSLLFQKNSTGTLYAVSPLFTLLPGEMVQYMDKVGWTYYAANGAIKSDSSLTLNSNGLVQYNNSDMLDLTLGGATPWIQQLKSGVQNWNCLASSADGTKLAATAGTGYIYTSTDSGATWAAQTAPDLQNWQAITSSADGTKLAAAVFGGYIYTSADSGLTWTQQTGSTSQNWWAMTSSPNGMILAACVSAGYIYTSIDGGVTWTQQTASPTPGWTSITMSADGTRLAAVAGVGYVYTSQDSGATWVQRTGSTSQNWQAITSSNDGTRVAAVANNGYIYTSRDLGVTWTQQTGSTSQYWQSITSSVDGTRLTAAVFSGYIYTSADFGVTWTQQTAAGFQTWSYVASSADGTKLSAVAYGGTAYTSSIASGLSWSSGPNPFGTNILALQYGSPSVQLNARTTDPTLSPGAVTLGLYARSTASNPMPSLVDPTLSPVSLQSSLYQRNTFMWTPGPTNVGTWFNTNGATIGSAASVSPATTTLYTTMRRSTFSSVVTTTNQQVGLRTDNTFLLGLTARAGGFFFSCRFGFDVIATGMRAFVGFCPSTVIVSGDPSTSLNTLGFGFDLADTAWSFYHNGAAGTATKETIGGQGTLATNNTGYDAYIWCNPGSTVVYYRLDRTDTGATIVDSSVNTNLPANSTALMATAQMSNGTANITASAAVLGVNRIYVETIR